KALLYVGRIHPEKGIGLLLDAFAALPAARREGWRLVLVGPAEAKYGGGGEGYFDRVRRRAEPLGSQVEWVGPVFDAARLHAYYRKAALFVYPSLAEKGETFGLAPLEAMAQGCPALVSALACFRDFIDPGVNGFVFDHRAADPVRALAGLLDALMEDGVGRERAGAHALRTTEAFSLECVAGQYLDDFASLVSRGG
ncbi:MAG: glycosyltransferase family 4 protein, partial [Chthoniobacteraceae bacterium]|nr:glycosyltransferase family 4 protein [Chthoniobacteraceae bacterium]